MQQRTRKIMASLFNKINMTNDIITKELIDKVIQDERLRCELSRKSHFWFFHIYLSNYITYETANFQKEIFSLTEDESIRNLVVVAFRGSAKSTILTTSLPIWSVIGRPRIKNILILSQTQSQAKDHLADIRREFEYNELLKKELGPFKQEDTWNSSSLILPKFGARITAASSQESIRGMKFGPHRPQLIIVDDAEDFNSVRTQEGRDKTYKWFLSEVLPLGDLNTRVIIAGNLLHHDSLIMKLKNNIDEGVMPGVFKSYPIADKEGNPVWIGKYKNKEGIEEAKLQAGDIITWLREYMLQIVADEGPVVKPEYIKYYDELPDKKSLRYVATGVDLAVSQKDKADYTAMVSANVYGHGRNVQIHILPNPINTKLQFPDIIKQIVVSNNIFGSGSIFYVENNAQQEYVVQDVKHEHGYINIQGVTVSGCDKRMRLAAATHPMQNGNIFFPRKGAEKLINQLLGFDTESHDDLCDAFSLMVNETIKKTSEPLPEVFFL
jgi:predicted phage terminase large subunit-like protein